MSSLLIAQEKVDEATNARIRSEELEHSQIMHTLHMLTDRYGPRVTGTPNHEAAAKWVVKQLTEWGFKNAHLEAWDFGHPGWSNERATAFIVSPVQENLKFEVLAWTPSTKGTVTGSAIQIVPPQGPLPPAPPARQTARRRRRTAAVAAADAAARRGSDPPRRRWTQWVKATQPKVKGKIVLVGKAAVIPVNFDPPAKRRARRPGEGAVRPQQSERRPRARRVGGGGGRGGATPDPNRLTRRRWPKRSTRCCSLAARWCA